MATAPQTAPPAKPATPPPEGAATTSAPAPAPKKPVKIAEKRAEEVKKLVEDLQKEAKDLDIKIGEPKTFGLELDVLDPLTGLLIAAAVAPRRDIGVAGSIMTPAEITSMVATARSHAQTAGLITYEEDKPKDAAAEKAA